MEYKVGSYIWKKNAGLFSLKKSIIVSNLVVYDAVITGFDPIIVMCNAHWHKTDPKICKSSLFSMITSSYLNSPPERCFIPVFSEIGYTGKKQHCFLAKKGHFE